MRNAVIRKRAIALKALRDSPLRLMLGSTMSETNLAAFQESRLWAIPEPTYEAAQ